MTYKVYNVHRKNVKKNPNVCGLCGAICVEFACSSRDRVASFGYSGSLPQSKNMW